MKAVIQRVYNAHISVDNTIVASIDNGLLVYLGIAHDDTEFDCTWICGKISDLRIFCDDNNKMNFSIQDTTKEVLVVSQFTLLADARKGRRPDFAKSAKGEMAINFYEKCLFLLREKGLKVSCGIFGADMKVSYVNDGPITIILDSQESRQ